MSVGRAAIQESKYNVSICLFELVDGDEANVFSRPVEFCRHPPPPGPYMRTLGFSPPFPCIAGPKK